jgi:hypothetical protein
MKTPLVLLTLLAGSILATPAWAGTPANPEISDAAGDAHGSVDVTSLWITSDASSVTFNLKLADLASEADPVFDNEGSWHNIYRIEYTLSSTGATYYAEVQISAVESQSTAGTNTPHVTATVTSNVGTQYSAGRTTPGAVPAGSATVDAAANLIKVTLTRDANLASGTVITGVTVKTFQNPTPHEMQNALTPIVGGGRVQKDVAGPGRSLTLL